MNIFQVDLDPIISAQALVDKHVVKMILESAQLLSTAHRVLDGVLVNEKTDTGRNVKKHKLNDDRENILYKDTHVNHPSSIWCRESISNYIWLFDHFKALLDEYTFRYNKKHKCSGAIFDALSIYMPNNLKKYELTKMPSCMDEIYIISDDPVQNYRNYYKHGKKHIHKWTNRLPPQWLN